MGQPVSLTYPLLTVVRRGALYSLAVGVSGLGSDPIGATATAELVRGFTGEIELPSLTATVAVAISSALTVTLDLDQLPIETRPGEYWIRFYLTLPGGELLVTPVDNSFAVFLT